MSNNASNMEMPRSFQGINHFSSTNTVHYSMSHYQKEHFLTTAGSAFVAKHSG